MRGHEARPPVAPPVVTSPRSEHVVLANVIAATAPNPCLRTLAAAARDITGDVASAGRTGVGGNGASARNAKEKGMLAPHITSTISAVELVAQVSLRYRTNELELEVWNQLARQLR